MTAVTWFVASTNQCHSAFSIPHFTFRIPQFRILPTAPFEIIQDGGVEFVRIENSAIRSAVPENPIYNQI